MSGLGACPSCAQELISAPMATGQQECVFCGLRYLALLAVPAAAAKPASPAVALAEEATCFFHAENAAATACSSCGRFVCNLCDVELDGHHHCPTCFEQGLQRQTLPSLRQRDTLYDSMALAAGWGWILFYPVWIFAVPAVLYWTIAKRKAPGGYLIPRRGWRYAAGIVGLLWPILLVTMVFLIPVIHRT